MTAIESEIKLLSESQKEVNKGKACLFNLIIFTQQTRRKEYFKDFIQSVIEKFPCRIFFIEGNLQNQEDCLLTSVSTEKIVKGDLVISCDQMTIEVSNKQLKRVPYLIYPLLIPDLPIYLVWGEDPTKPNEIFASLCQMATRIIFDSESTDNLQAFCCKILGYSKSLNIDFMDINWAKIEGWRGILTQIFNTPEKINKLMNSKEIQIEYNGFSTDWVYHNEIQACYLQGWLASRFQWQYEKKENKTNRISYRTDSKTLNITLRPSKNDLVSPGAILSVAIKTQDNCEFNISRTQNSQQAIIHISTQETCEVPYTLLLPNFQRGLHFMQEIFYEGTSKQFLEMLNTLSKQECISHAV